MTDSLQGRSRIDEFLPSHDFAAAYEIDVNAPPSKVYDGLLAADFNEAWIVRLLMTLRSCRRVHVMAPPRICASDSAARALSSWPKFPAKNW